jgi:ADP-heptose:LPS heptosyltransferase/glycosyltransferase involved in cell wall biosynthesis
MNINPKKILVIQHKQIGDVILTTPVVKVLKKHFPDARISFLIEKFCYPILEGNPHIDDIISLDKSELKNLFSQFNYYFKIRSMGFDLVLDFFQNPRSSLIAFLSGADTTISYNHPSRGRFYKIKVNPKPGYAVDYKLSMLESIGIKSNDNYPEIFISEVEKGYIDKYFDAIGIKEDDFVVCIDATHRRPTRRWTCEGYAKLIDMLCAKYNAKVILLWGPGEYKRAYKIKELCAYNCFIACRTDLKQLTALISRSSLLIGNDSAPRHIAVSQKVPTLVILGSTSEAWTHPDPIHKVVYKGLDCQPCNKNTCKYDYKCLKELSADEVFAALQLFKEVSDSLEHYLTRELKEKVLPIPLETKREKMKVALLHKKYYFYGGTERYITNLAAGLLDAGHEVTIFANTWGRPFDERINFRKIPILKGTKLFKLASFALMARLILRNESFDVVQGFGKTVKQDVFRTGGGCHKAWQKESLLSIKSPFLRKLKYINRLFSIRQWITLFIENRTFSKGNYKKIISPSKKVKEQIMQYYNVPDKDIEVIHNGVDPLIFNLDDIDEKRKKKREEYDVKADETLLVFAATNFELKGLEFLIRAVGHLKDRKIKLMVVGGGKPAPYEHLANELGVIDKVIFTGVANKISEFYKAGDIFIYPTFYDPFANTCLEAMACGLPVITSRINGVAEILADHESGLVLENPSDDKEIAEKIEMLLDDELLRKKIAKNSIELSKKYTMANNTKKIIKVYKQVRRF